MKKYLITLLFLSLFAMFSHSFKASASLIVPSSSDVYLSFDNAVDLCVSNSYYLIAENTKLHIYNRETGEYRVTSTTFTIKKIESNSSGIFVLSSQLKIYYSRFDVINFSQLDGDNTASDFAVNDNFLLRMFETSVEKHSILNGVISSGQTATGQDFKKIVFEGNTNNYYIDNTNNNYQIAHSGNHLYSLKESGFYKANQQLTTSKYKSLKYFGENIYLLSSNKVVAYNVESGFTDFEISSASSKNGRLNGANDIFGYGDYLYVADTLNKRVSVFDKSGSFIENFTDFDGYPKYVSATNEKLLIVTDTTATLNGESLFYIVDLSLKEPICVKLDYAVGIEIISVTASVNDFYILAKNASIANSPVLLITINPNKNITSSTFDRTLTPLKITCGFGGDLFILFDNGNICKYKYENISSTLKQENIIYSIENANQIIKINIDFEESIYALLGDTMIKKTATETFNFDIVNSDYENEHLKSFALYLSENNCYILYTNTLIVTDTLQIGSFSNIQKPDNFSLYHANDIYQINKPSFISIDNGKAIFLFNFQESEDIENFPIKQYIQMPDIFNALVISETEDYYIIAYTDAKPNSNLNAGLILKGGDVQLNDTLSFDKEFEGYLIADSAVFYYPTLKTYLAVDDLKLNRFDSVTLYFVDSITESNSFDFYYIELDGDICGYVPKSFIAEKLTEPFAVSTINYKKVVGENIVLYSDANLSEKLADIISGSKVNVLSTENGRAFVEVAVNGQLFKGYIDSQFIEVKGENAVRNALVISLLALSFTITSFYFLSRKKPNII